jgi:hypothetical protein
MKKLTLTDEAPSSRIILSTAPKVIRVTGTIVMGATSGPIFLQWAQNVADSNATAILRGSYLKAEELQ